MNGKRAKALRRAARVLAKEPSRVQAQLFERAKLVKLKDGDTKVIAYTAVTAHYPNLSARSLYQRMKKLVVRRGAV